MEIECSAGLGRRLRAYAVVSVLVAVLLPATASAATPGAITARFVPAEFATHYSVDLTGFTPPVSVAWTLKLQCVDIGCPANPPGTAAMPKPNVDNGCDNNGVGTTKPDLRTVNAGETPKDFVWTHPDPGVIPPFACDHSKEAPSPGHGHQGLITAVVSDAQMTCQSDFKGTHDSTPASFTDGTARVICIKTTLASGSASGNAISVASGADVTDTATLTGPNAASAADSVSFSVFAGAGCTGALVVGEHFRPVANAAAGPVSLGTTGLNAGTYYVEARYLGDANNPTVTSCNEQFTVLPQAATVCTPAPTLSLSGPANAFVGDPTTMSFNPSGGTPPFTYTVTGAPPGLALTGDTLTGTPTALGPYTVTVTATDSQGCPTTASSRGIDILPRVTVEKYDLASHRFVAFGEEIAFTINVTVNASVHNMSLADHLPPGCRLPHSDSVYLFGLYPPGETLSQSGQDVSVTYFSLEAGAALHVRVVCKMVQLGDFTNTASVSSTEEPVAVTASDRKLTVLQPGETLNMALHEASLSGTAENPPGAGGKAADTAVAAALTPSQLALERLKLVQVAIRRVLPHGPKCEWLASPGGGFESVTPNTVLPKLLGTCNAPIWLNAHGINHWKLRLTRRLPRGQYIAIAHAVDQAGVADDVFSIAKDNEIRFTVH
ncbi:MAG: putative Ig domain-containing protein [Terriglobales bacterium]